MQVSATKDPSKVTFDTPLSEAQSLNYLGNDDVISLFFERMEDGRTRQTCLKQLEAFLIDQKPKLALKTIHQLMFSTSCQSIFVSMSSECCLTASTATHLLAKLLNYQKNPHAELFIRELGSVSPELLSLFELESLLDNEACQGVLL